MPYPRSYKFIPKLITYQSYFLDREIQYGNVPTYSTDASNLESSIKVPGYHVNLDFLTRLGVRPHPEVVPFTPFPRAHPTVENI